MVIETISLVDQALFPPSAQLYPRTHVNMTWVTDEGAERGSTCLVSESNNFNCSLISEDELTHLNVISGELFIAVDSYFPLEAYRIIQYEHQFCGGRDRLKYERGRVQTDGGYKGKYTTYIPVSPSFNMSIYRTIGLILSLCMVKARMRSKFQQDSRSKRQNIFSWSILRMRLFLKIRAASKQCR